MWNKHYNYDANKIISSVSIFTFTFYLFSFWACEATNGLMYCNCITSCFIVFCHFSSTWVSFALYEQHYYRKKERLND